MAVPGISHREHPVSGAAQVAAWSGVITWALIAVFALVIVLVLVTVIGSYAQQRREGRERASWDELFLTLRDTEPEPRQRIPLLESLWDKVAGTSAQPYVALALAQMHFDMANETTRAERDRRQSLAKSRAVYDLVRKQWADNPAYGPLAAQGAALCREQEGDLDGAIETLKEAVGKYDKHFLYENLCYDLARNYWLRSLKSEAAKKDPTADRKEAQLLLSRAVTEVRDPRVQEGWRQEARFLKSLLEKPGPALKIFPKGLLPPPKKDEAKKEEPKKDEPKKAGAKGEEPKKDEGTKKEAGKQEPKKEAPAKAEPDAKVEKK